MAPAFFEFMCLHSGTGVMDSAFAAASARRQASGWVRAVENRADHLPCRLIAMFALSAISLTGMKAAQSALGGSAHHIAKLATVGFRRDQVSQLTSVDGGVGFPSRLETREGNALEADIVGLLSARNQFLANLAVFRASNQMTGSLLDISG